MTKTAKSKNTDPFATVRAALVEGVDALTENHGKVVELAHVEADKAKTAAA